MFILMRKMEDILALNIRMRLEEMGITQRELAKRSGMHEQFISKILRGKSFVRKNNLEALAKALGCTKEELLIDPNSLPPKPKPTPTVENLIEVIRAQEKELELYRALTEIYRPIEGLFDGLPPSQRTYLIRLINAAHDSLRSGRLMRIIFSVGILGGDISTEIKLSEKLERLLSEVEKELSQSR